MLSLLKGALSGVWGYVATGLAAMVGLLAMYFSAKKAGKDEVKAAAAEKEIEDVKTARKVERDVAGSKSDDVRKRLRKFTRD